MANLTSNDSCEIATERAVLYMSSSTGFEDL
jgi:hypothetical protein